MVVGVVVEKEAEQEEEQEEEEEEEVDGPAEGMEGFQTATECEGSVA